MRTVAIVQARLGSTRLPRKVMAEVGDGLSVIERLLFNLMQCAELENVCIASAHGNEELYQHIKPMLDQWYRMSWFVPDCEEDDLVGRYLAAADLLDADAVVRVTADSPLLDPKEVDHLVRAYKDHPCDYMAFAPEIRGMQSVEILSRDALNRLSEMSLTSEQREHCGVTYILAHHKQFTMHFVKPLYEQIPHPLHRVCVDEQADLDVVRALVDALGDRANDTKSVVEWLNDHSDVAAINNKVRQR